MLKLFKAEYIKVNNSAYVYKKNKQLIYSVCLTNNLKYNVMETMDKKCIYVLEDNANIADIIEFLLTEEEYSVEVCKNASTFWKKMESHQPDMIVLDVMLPDANGLDICLTLKKNIRTHRIPILMMSANNRLSTVKNKCEADSYINKPFDLNDFMGRVDYFSHQSI